MAKVPKCRFCGKTHYGNCGPEKERRVVSRLAQLEMVIERGAQAYIEAGKALAEIKEKRLYKEQGYSNFDDYCDARWGFSRSRAEQLIEGSAVARLPTIVGLPKNEAQAREVAKVVRTEGVDAANEVMATAGPNATAKTIRKIAKERKQPALEPTYAIEQPCTHENAKCLGCGEKGKLA